MFQCPPRAFLISTIMKVETIIIKVVFQCPLRAFLISTEKAVFFNVLRTCFNALHGLFLFLQRALWIC